MIYPFLDRIREVLDKKEKSLAWLLGEIDKSERWFYLLKDRGYEKVEAGIIEQISEALQFNFTADYNKWRLDNETAPRYLLEEPGDVYLIASKRINIQIQLSATVETAETNTSRMLAVLRKEGEKLGFRVE